MRSVKLARKVMANHDYQVFRSLMAEMQARVEATPLEHGVNAVEVVDCCVSFDPGLAFMTREERATFDTEKHWQRILDLCKQRGLEPVPEAEAASTK